MVWPSAAVVAISWSLVTCVGLLVPIVKTTTKLHRLQHLEWASLVRRQPQMGDAMQATRHLVAVTSALECRLPRPSLVRVRACHPYLPPTAKVSPHSALLHECSDASGCCRSDTHSCVPTTVEQVTLHFHVDSHVRHLAFVNHTECGCEPVPEYQLLAYDKQHSPLCAPAEQEDTEELGSTDHHQVSQLLEL